MIDDDVLVSLQMFSMDCYFRQNWRDTRLTFVPYGNISELRPSIKMLDEIWKPDTFFLNGQSSYLHTITYSNKFFRIGSNGDIHYSQRHLFYLLTIYIAICLDGNTTEALKERIRAIRSSGASNALSVCMSHLHVVRAVSRF